MKTLSVEFFCLSYQGTQKVAAGPEPSASGLCVEWLTVQCREDSVLYEGWATADSPVVCLQ